MSFNAIREKILVKISESTILYHGGKYSTMDCWELNKYVLQDQRL